MQNDEGRVQNGEMNNSAFSILLFCISWGGAMLSIDLKGKRALVAGVADDAGFGFAIAKALAEAGATVCLATWPPALGIFKTLLERGKLDESLAMPDGGKLAFERIDPLDAD